MMRTVLYHCFGLKSGSLYPNDLGGNKALENYVGHIEHSRDGRIYFPTGSIPLIKTHEVPSDANPAIYVVRDGRAACLSVWNFYGQKISMQDIITGPVRVGSWQFGNWSSHLLAWRPWERPNTLLVRYEDLVGNLSAVVPCLSRFLCRAPLTDRIPSRTDIAAVDGRWVRGDREGADGFPPELQDLFRQYHGAMMQQMGY
jgi:hypothetical protein